MRRSLLTVTTTWNSPRSAPRRSIVQAAFFGLECLTNLIFAADSRAETRACSAGDVCACSQADAVTMPRTAAPVAMVSRIRGITSFLLKRTILDREPFAVLAHQRHFTRIVSGNCACHPNQNARN